MRYQLFCMYKRFRDAKDGIGVVEVILILVEGLTVNMGKSLERPIFKGRWKPEEKIKESYDRSNP